MAGSVHQGSHRKWLHAGRNGGCGYGMLGGGSLVVSVLARDNNGEQWGFVWLAGSGWIG